MAAPLCQVMSSRISQFLPKYLRNSSIFTTKRCFMNLTSNTKFAKYYQNAHKKGISLRSGVGLVTGLALSVYLADLHRRTRHVLLADSETRPKHTVIRSIRNDNDRTGLKLTLYQYQTCPFCCKVRAYLDYHGLSYDVVEVNSVWRTQIKWSQYRKVPILVCDDSRKDGYVQLNDSSVIISCLETFMKDQSQSMHQIKSYYPALESTEKRRTVYEYPNKYFIMYGDRKPDDTPKERKKEREWRSWVDSNLVHVLSPNIYRTVSEARQSFQYFSDIGQWDKVFSSTERFVVINVGAVAMYLVGKMLTRKYNLKSDVRESLYDSCREWTKAIGKKKDFMGGDKPNLADLAVYGALSAIEGCQAFDDLVENTTIYPWYQRTKAATLTHSGSHPVTLEATS